MPRINYRDDDGTRLPGVTTVIGILDKPALLWWAYGEGLTNYNRLGDQITETLNSENSEVEKIRLSLDVLKNFEPTRLYDKRDKAADAGTLAHAIVEAHLKQTEMPSLDGLSKDIVDKATGCFQAFLEWERAHKFEMVKSEQSLISRKHKFGGTIDIGAILGDLCIVDIKTSSGVYISMKIQVSAYFELWNENYPNDQVKSSHILRLGAEGEFDHHYWPTLKNEWEIFKHCLAIRKILKQTNQKL